MMEVYLVRSTRVINVVLKYRTSSGIINDCLLKRTLDVFNRFSATWSTWGKLFDI